ncbi:ribbon-helix-helix domain-containing protein [Sphingobium sp. AN641]|uniref:ribbon-helix-helix domain-containing protein n=1 Tax=Sphingobium sp. AN641 TaxID=3133443 RepID=UPI0030BF279B
MAVLPVDPSAFDGPLANRPPYAPPVKRSITIAGHATAISLEPIFWDALREAAAARGLPISALVAQIDVARLAVSPPPNLASAIRCWLFDASRRTDSATDVGS